MKKETKIEMPSFKWTGVRVRFADADEALDAMEAEEYTNEVAVEENTSSMATDDDEEKEEKRTRPVAGRNRPMSADLEVALQPILEPNDAKCYARSAAPTSHGKMCLNILNIADRCVFV